MRKLNINKYASLRDPKTLTGAALLIAFAIIIDYFRLVLGPTAEISFNYLALVVAGMLYGPVVGGLVGLISDVLSYVLRPTGPFFPGFTLNSIILGVMYGLFFYKKKMKLSRITVCYLLAGVITSIILTPIWLKILYGTKLFAIPRVVRFIVLAPIKILLIYLVAKGFEKGHITSRVQS